MVLMKLMNHGARGRTGTHAVIDAAGQERRKAVALCMKDATSGHAGYAHACTSQGSESHGNGSTYSTDRAGAAIGRVEGNPQPRGWMSALNGRLSMEVEGASKHVKAGAGRSALEVVETEMWISCVMEYKSRAPRVRALLNCAGGKRPVANKVVISGDVWQI